MTLQLANMRTPTESRSTRMEPLARLPVFFALEDRRAMVAGGSAGAAWKAELLSAAGASVDVYAAAPSDELLAVAINPPRGEIVLHQRAWTEADMMGAAIAVGGFEDEVEAAGFAEAARRMGVPVNVIDKPEFCDFAFGAIVNRSPLVIGISTDGAAPVFGQAIRAKLEAMIPRGFARWAEAAQQNFPQSLAEVPLLDAAPTILAAAGLPAARNMPGRAQIFPELPRVDSWDALVQGLPWVDTGQGGAGVNDDALRAIGYIDGPAPTPKQP